MVKKTIITIGVLFAMLASSIGGQKEVVVAPSPTPSPSRTPSFEIRVGSPAWLSGARGQVRFTSDESPSFRRWAADEQFIPLPLQGKQGFVVDSQSTDNRGFHLRTRP